VTGVVTEDGKNMSFGSYCDEMMSEEPQIFLSVSTNHGINYVDEADISRPDPLFTIICLAPAAPRVQMNNIR